MKICFSFGLNTPLQAEIGKNKSDLIIKHVRLTSLTLLWLNLMGRLPWSVRGDVAPYKCWKLCTQTVTYRLRVCMSTYIWPFKSIKKNREKQWWCEIPYSFLFCGAFKLFWCRISFLWALFSPQRLIWIEKENVCLWSDWYRSSFGICCVLLLLK